MKILLDTNALIWWLEDPQRLGEKARNIIENPMNDVFCSSISAVEIAIKTSIGKLTLETPWEGAARESLLSFLSFTQDHARRFSVLPLFHKDPFDRMLIAQALVEGATFVTSDGELECYGIQLLKAG